MSEDADGRVERPASEANGPAASGRFMHLVERLPPALLAKSLTHSSWVEDRVDSYERLEFLGDSVLGLAISAHIYERYPEYSEGRLAKLKAYVVSRESCSLVADRLGIRELVLSESPADPEQREELAANQTALGNILEAIIGALYIAFGYEEIRVAVVEAFSERIRYGRTRHVDFKSTLQEHLAAQTPELMARYRLVREEGPPHRRLFTSEVIIAGQVRGVGAGRSIKSSEQEAARAALRALGVLEERPAGDSGDPQ
ncbi:MAG: ribonuclease III [Thermoleophilia bacterium]